MEKVTWNQIGDKDGKIGPLSQGYSGVMTNPREHARFCYLALHHGEWEGKQVVPASYYDFAWQGTKVKPEYGAVVGLSAAQGRAEGSGADGRGRNNHGYVVPSLDLVFVRLGDGEKYAKNYEDELVNKVLAAVEK